MIERKHDRTIDPGERVRAVMSGWQAYSTSDSTIDKPKEIISGAEIIDRLRNLEDKLNVNTLDLVFRTLEKHIKDKNNPHELDLNKFIAGIMELLYQIYLENGYTGTFDYFKQEFFKFFRIASISDLIDGIDGSSLVTLDGIREFIKYHDEDENAHKALFENLTPGIPTKIDPSFSISSLVGFPSYIQTTTPSSRWSFIDRDGYLYFSNNSYLPIDYRYNEPLIPIFETRTNFIPYSNSLDKSHVDLRYLRISRTDANGVIRNNGIELIEKKDFDPAEHQIVFKDLLAEEEKAYSFSFYYLPKHAKYIDIEIKEKGLLGATIVYHFDMVKNRAELSAVSDTAGKNRCEIIKLPSDIFLLSVTFVNSASRNVNITITPYKSKEEGKVYIGDQNPIGIFNCFQFEEGDNPSPYIPTEENPVTRNAIPVTINRENQINNRNWLGDNRGTIVCSYRCPLNLRDNIKNTIYHFRKDNKKVISAEHREDGLIYLSISKNGNQIWELPISDSSVRIKSLVHAYTTTVQRAACTEVRPLLSNIVDDDIDFDITHLDIGHDNGTNYLNGYLRKIYYYPTSLQYGELVFVTN